MYQDECGENNKGLLRRLSLATRRAQRRAEFRDGYFADPARVEDDYVRLRRPHD